MTLTLAPETEAQLLAAATEKGLAPEEVVDILLRQDATEIAASAQAPKTPVVQDTPEQARMQAALFDMIAKAQALVSEPAQAKSDQAEEERLFGEIVTEKYRKQGFNLP